MKKVGIIGLGLIGGSMAKAISTYTDSIVYGWNRTHTVTEKALEEGAIHCELDDTNLGDIDMLIVSLYPKLVVPKILELKDKLKKGCIVVDCTGIKTMINNGLSKTLNEEGIFFVGGHPMAGREVAGFESALTDLYKGASMILVRDEYTNEEAFRKAKDFFMKLGFGRVKESTPEEHDRVIAYTSQLCHVVSNAYVKSDTLPLRAGFSAGSYKDLTRVAKLNEDMWTDLFFDNKDALLREMDIILANLKEYRDALASDDEERMRQLLRDGRIIKEEDLKI